MEFGVKFAELFIKKKNRNSNENLRAECIFFLNDLYSPQRIAIR